MIGAVIIKHKLCLSDEEAVQQIQENPYLQYFVGLPGYQMEAPFASSLFVEIRKRIGQGYGSKPGCCWIDCIHIHSSEKLCADRRGLTF